MLKDWLQKGKPLSELAGPSFCFPSNLAPKRGRRAQEGPAEWASISGQWNGWKRIGRQMGRGKTCLKRRRNFLAVKKEFC